MNYMVMACSVVMRLNLRRIDVFRVVMDSDTVSNAAARLNVSQPAVSKAINHLETELPASCSRRLQVDWSGGSARPLPR
jgi:hypothetical protein